MFDHSLRFGPYLTPLVAIGVQVACEVRGLVRIVGLSEAPIPWPIGERDGNRELIVYRGLARALRQETAEAITGAWGVSESIVREWQAVCTTPYLRRRALSGARTRPWTPEEDDLVRTLTIDAAAQQTGRSKFSVVRRRATLVVAATRTVEQQ